jgi:hypothetical protein
LQKISGNIPDIQAAMSLLEKNAFPENWLEVFQNFYKACNELHAKLPEQKHAIEHLVILGEIAEDFLAGKEVPRHVGPSRQVRLINKCNARCIMCAGKFNGDIVSGAGMDEAFVNQTLEPAQDIISYASEASEFLLFRKWREIAEKLAENGLPKLRVYTNGILAAEENVRYLLDRNVLETFHFSMNGASRDVIESGQVNVKFEKLVENIRHLFNYAEEKRADFHLTFSFVIMRRNYHEMPLLVRLVNELRGNNRALQPAIYFAFLETNNDMDNYREFLFQEHHALVPEAELLKSFSSAAQLGKEFGIHTTLFETTLEDFLASGKRPPKLVCKERDLRLLVNGLKNGVIDPACVSAMQGTTPAVEELLDLLRCDTGNLKELDEALTTRELLLAEKNDVVIDGFDAIETSATNRWRWALGNRQVIEFTAHAGANEINYQLLLPKADTQLALRVDGEMTLNLRAADKREVVAGKLAFRKSIPGRVRLEIETSPCPHVFDGADARPLAYAVYSFELTRGV